ncbi:hypothetical protein [Actinoplanes teichomyceticus]|uniref:Uncharacterized protein n=1 Tax=Actinoplanes teichomyceticus TaxID=1867 RepID=A0A561WB60_ACTTI|nr:hypothetical protein [Actinoplanes teichomyceticus]TWG21106.1 hypothetical protein FHX34_103636 [Actinoplanes teichomyceticus]GIF14926.1 hypothetical protein Ate01nite_49580 [Actinoplanes teichomyceticus]
MTLDRSGQLWRGDNFADLAEYIRHFKAGGYPVNTVTESRCGECDGTAFRINIDGDEATRRVCLSCGAAAFIGDSGEHWNEEEHDSCACPCGSEEFTAAVGYALFDDGEVRWVSLGLRCLKDNTLGVYADTKVDYSPSRHLLDQA